MRSLSSFQGALHVGQAVRRLRGRGGFGWGDAQFQAGVAQDQLGIRGATRAIRAHIAHQAHQGEQGLHPLFERGGIFGGQEGCAGSILCAFVFLAVVLVLAGIDFDLSYRW